MSKKGKFIVLEGLEGAGKTTAMNAITTLLEDKKIPFIKTREPGGTPMAEAIRECVKYDWDEAVHEKTELLLMYAARMQLVSNTILPALERGEWVIGDRHDLSSVAYQGGGRGVEKQILSTLRELTLGNFKPDLTLYLDIDPELGLARVSLRGEPDRIERASLDFFQRTRAVYQEHVAKDDAVFQIDGSLDRETVAKHVTNTVKTCLL